MDLKNNKHLWIAGIAMLAITFVIVGSALMAGNNTSASQPAKSTLDTGAVCSMQQGGAEGMHGCDMMGGDSAHSGHEMQHRKAAMQCGSNGCGAECPKLTGKVVAIDKKDGSVTVKGKLDARTVQNLKVGSQITLMVCQHAAQVVKSAAAKYICPMCPGVSSDKPGTCPKCGMNLVPAKK